MAYKLQLKEDSFAPVSIFGIITDLPDYRLCYVINHELSLRLCRTEKDKELLFKNRKLKYSEFVHHDPVKMLTWRLTSNANAVFYNRDHPLGEATSVPLVNDLRGINFFLWCEDENSESLNKFVASRLRNNKYIRAVRQIDRSTSKNIENLLLEY